MVDDHAIARTVGRNVRTNGDHCPRSLMTRNNAGLGARQFAGAVQHVVVTDACDFYLHEDIAGTRLRRRKVSNLQVFGRTEFFDHDRFHLQYPVIAKTTIGCA